MARPQIQDFKIFKQGLALHRWVWFFCAGLWILSIIGTWFLAQRFVKPESPSAGISVPESKYKFLSPRLATEKYGSREEREAKIFIHLIPLREKILNFIAEKLEEEEEEEVAFYIEDLNSGAWIGYQEREKFIGASLLKTPLAMAVMRKVDIGEWNLQTKFVLKSELKDKSFGNLWREPDNKEFTLEELMYQMFVYSDDTAANIFFNNLSGEERDAIYYHIGVLNPEVPITSDPSRPLFKKISAKELVNIYRSLYNAVFLTRDSSEYILNLLTQTKFDNTLPAGVPSYIPVAHKIGVFFITGKLERNAHDCGIIYFPSRPYVICAMTKDIEKDRAWEVVSGISRVAYEYFESETRK
jgi:beta-lactamase class A